VGVVICGHGDPFHGLDRRRLAQPASSFNSASTHGFRA